MLRSKHFKNKILLYTIIITVLVAVLPIFFYKEQIKMAYSNPEAFRQYIDGFGIFAPIIFIAIQIIQIFIVFIPSSTFTIASGYIFGTMLGAFYSFISVIIGSIILFYTSRILGRKFIEIFIDKKDLIHFDVFFRKRGNAALIIARMVPVIFPTDIVSFAAGLTPMRFKDYILISFFGLIPNILILSFFGDKLSSGVGLATNIILAILGTAVLVYPFRHKLKMFFI